MACAMSKPEVKEIVLGVVQDVEQDDTIQLETKFQTIGVDAEAKRGYFGLISQRMVDEGCPLVNMSPNDLVAPATVDDMGGVVFDHAGVEVVDTGLNVAVLAARAPAGEAAAQRARMARVDQLLKAARRGGAAGGRGAAGSTGVIVEAAVRAAVEAALSAGAGRPHERTPAKADSGAGQGKKIISSKGKKGNK